MAAVVLVGLPALSTTGEDARRRFANFVDICWDRDSRLVVTSTLPQGAVLDATVTDLARMRNRLSLLSDV